MLYNKKYKKYRSIKTVKAMSKKARYIDNINIRDLSKIMEKNVILFGLKLKMS